MKYFNVDFSVLVVLSRSTSMTVDQLLLEMANDIGWATFCPEGLSSAIAVLEKDGYITLETRDGILSSDTVISITDKGRTVTAVSGIARWFAALQRKTIERNEHRFCELSRPRADAYRLDHTSFTAWSNSEIAARSNSNRFFFIENAEDERYILSLRNHYQDASEEENTSFLSITCDLDGLRRMLNDLVDAALDLTESTKVRKVVLMGRGKAYVLTFSYMTDEAGYSILRMTAAPILFNRQRFIGKRDADLDYAQCGDNILTAEFSSVNDLIESMGETVISRLDLLDEDLGEKAHKLYTLYR